jgi:hypothetical protein
VAVSRPQVIAMGWRSGTISLPELGVLLLEGRARGAPSAAQSRLWRVQALEYSVYDPRRPTLAHRCMVSTLDRSNDTTKLGPESVYEHTRAIRWTQIQTRIRSTSDPISCPMSTTMTAAADPVPSHAHPRLCMPNLQPARASRGSVRRHHPYTFSIS